MRYGVLVEDGTKDYEQVVKHYADLVLCTGSTICNGSIVNFLELGTQVLFLWHFHLGKRRAHGPETRVLCRPLCLNL